MSQTIQPPLLPETSPDRMVNCEVALETAFAAFGCGIRGARMDVARARPNLA